MVDGRRQGISKKWSNIITLEGRRVDGDDSLQLEQKIIPKKDERATTSPRPPLESSWRGESKYFEFSFIIIFWFLIFQNM